MTNQSLEQRRTCLYRCIQKACLNCSTTRPCPPLVVIAMRYAQAMDKGSGR